MCGVSEGAGSHPQANPGSLGETASPASQQEPSFGRQSQYLLKYLAEPNHAAKQAVVITWFTANSPSDLLASITLYPRRCLAALIAYICGSQR